MGGSQMQIKFMKCNLMGQNLIAHSQMSKSQKPISQPQCHTFCQMGTIVLSREKTTKQWHTSTGKISQERDTNPPP
jgi:hypothetical protein